MIKILKNEKTENGNFFIFFNTETKEKARIKTDNTSVLALCELINGERINLKQAECFNLLDYKSILLEKKETRVQSDVMDISYLLVSINGKDYLKIFHKGQDMLSFSSAPIKNIKSFMAYTEKKLQDVEWGLIDERSAIIESSESILSGIRKANGFYSIKK